MSRQPFHLVKPSRWPFLTACNAFGVATGLVVWFHAHAIGLLVIRVVSLLAVLALWWWDVITESDEGHHTPVVARGLRYGMLIFIVSEAMFFVGFFWAFFHRALAPTPQMGCRWPPVGIEPVDPFGFPLFGTALLLSSGFSVTWAQQALLVGWIQETLTALSLTIGLGVMFTLVQLTEYYYASFTIADGIYGSTFYMLTGFHGLHVIIGTIFLGVNWWRVKLGHFTRYHHLGFEFGAWYWHFVDGVWLGVYFSVYLWGSIAPSW